jgi:glycosyltransferase involved in cell wall biosynthesis
MPHPEPVSVVITNYNLARYIGAAIDSATSQDYDGQIEIIVVDDASTDASLDVIKRHSGANVVALPKNGGVLNAMLAGLRRASHDIVMLLDGDDVWDTGKVRETVAAFAKDDRTAFVTHDLRYIDGDGQPLDRRSRVEAKFRGVDEGRCSDLLIDGVLLHRDYVWLGSALSFRKSRCDLDGFFEFCDKLPDAANTYQDWPLAFWIASIPGARLAIVRKPLFSYRLHGLNHSGDAATLPKAVRNVRRALNTALAMRAIADLRGLAPKIKGRLNGLTHYYSYLLMCYSGRRASAFAPFLLSAPLLIRDGLILKELVRLVSFFLLPPRHATQALNFIRGKLRLV